MKKKTKTQRNFHQNKKYGNLIKVNYKNNNFREERKYSIEAKRNKINSDFNIWYNNQIIIKNNYKPKNISSGFLQGKILNNDIIKNEKIDTEPKYLNTNNNYFQNKNFITEYYPHQTFMTRQHSRNLKEIFINNTEKLKSRHSSKEKNNIESFYFFPYNKENILNVRMRVHKFLTEQFFKKNKNEKDNNEKYEELTTNTNVLTNNNLINSTLASSERKNENIIIKSKINNIENNKKKQYLTSKQSFDDINKRNKDLENFLCFTNNIINQPKSSKNLFKKENNIPKPDNPFNNIKNNINLNNNEFQQYMKKHNSYQRIKNNLKNNNDNNIKIEVHNNNDNEEENKILKEKFNDNLGQSINSNPDMNKKLNNHSKEFILRKVKMIKRHIKKN